MFSNKWLFLAVCMLIIPLVSASYCFQESSNQSFLTDGNCTLNFTGGYSDNAKWYNQDDGETLNSSRLYDGDYSLGVVTNGVDDAFFYINYSYPSEPYTGALWNISTGFPSNSVLQLIDYSCYFDNTAPLQLEVFYDVSAAFMYFYCFDYNIEEFVLVMSSTEDVFVEESIYWVTYDSIGGTLGAPTLLSPTILPISEVWNQIYNGAPLSAVLRVYNPSVYDKLISQFKLTFSFDKPNLGDFPDNLMLLISYFFKYVFRQPATLVAGV